MQLYKKILILGSGALKIGQAGEFDYSGSQALKALQEEGIETILINPNIATVQTTHLWATKVYLHPIIPFFVKKIIEKEKPQAILLSFGGQTALNCGTALAEAGFLEQHNVAILGSPLTAITNSENRAKFKACMQSIGVKTAKSAAATSLTALVNIAKEIGFPLMLRSAYTLGGLGSGVIDTEKDFIPLAKKTFAYSPQILVEESLLGWKEIEYEVMRDAYGNCLVICNMENIDPVGIHTGDSMVVAPSQTLNDDEYQLLRSLSIKIAHTLGIIGECNVQFALATDRLDYRVIEVNARLSRSSALASKATGYPIAWVATKLCLGYGLHELKNELVPTHNAFFEPALDYVVCKFPRWDFEQFKGATQQVGSSMQSVGEVMAIGGSFEEAFQKGLRMLDTGHEGFESHTAIQDIEQALQVASDKRIFAIALALEKGYTVTKIHQLTKIDTWFIERWKNIIGFQKKLKSVHAIKMIQLAKQAGYSDRQIGKLCYPELPRSIAALKVRTYRKKHQISPVIKQIDSLAAAASNQSNYLYITYHGQGHDISFNNSASSVFILGGGPYHIGSSVEFDYAAVMTAKTVRQLNFPAVVINCNPETVSTDYHHSDRLYFEELSLERILDLVDIEQPKGLILSMGGQRPNTLAKALAAQGVPLLGTSAEAIDRAENRARFSKLLDQLNIKQPAWQALNSETAIWKFVKQVGFPILIRPSYVLSGASMQVLLDQLALQDYLSQPLVISDDYPIVVSKFIEDAMEIEFDALAQQGIVIDYAIAEHIEPAGIHSGDASLVFPPQILNDTQQRYLVNIASILASSLKINGPFNIQFLLKEETFFIIELNMRSSRSMPFIAKVAQKPWMALATKILLNQPVPIQQFVKANRVGVKVAQFSFQRLAEASLQLGVRMQATGEVAAIGKDQEEALLLAMLAVGYRYPQQGIFIDHTCLQKLPIFLQKTLHHSNFTLHSQASTSFTIVQTCNEEQLSTAILNQLFDLVIIPSNTLLSQQQLLRLAVDHNIPSIQNRALAIAFLKAIISYTPHNLAIEAI